MQLVYAMQGVVSIMIQRGFRVALTVMIACGVSFTAEQTWTGQISASMCNAAHNTMDHDCILNCIKAGAKYVFASKGKVLEIQNQDFGDLEKYAGQTVKLTGALGSDGKAVTVSKVEAASGR
jgi:hypothetical protein